MEKKMPIKSMLFINDLLYKYYREIRDVKKNKDRLTAYVDLSFPKHLLYAMGIMPVYPQFHAGLQSARGNQC